MELLKDVESKNDLIIRLVVHDIEEDSQNNTDQGIMSHENEVVLSEVVPEECLGKQPEVTTKPTESKVVSPKSTASTSSLKKILSLSKSQSTSSANIESTETTLNHIKESKERQVKRPATEHEMSTCSTAMAVTDSTWEKMSQHKVSEKYDC